MKLTDLDPRWIGDTIDGKSITFGLSFNCPNYDGKDEVFKEKRISIYFKPFIDPHNLNIDPKASQFWNRASGDTFENLTLTPSIDFKYHHWTDKVDRGWHGFITNGEIITC